MLQPVVENAVIHGILPKPGGGKIEIQIARASGLLRFSVRDDGVGMTDLAIEQVVKNDTEGVGLANISQRLYALYKEKLNIKSTPGQGTEVSWEVPLNGKRRNGRRLK
jgi:sensor histidine kinase YesM